LRVAVGEEGQMGRHPIRGGSARPLGRETLRFRFSLVERPGGGKDERGDSGREALDRSSAEGEPKRSRKPRRAGGSDPG
jgi:hypothetical protein